MQFLKYMILRGLVTRSLRKNPTGKLRAIQKKVGVVDWRSLTGRFEVFGGTIG